MSPWNVHRFFFGGGRLSLWGAWILFAPPPPSWNTFRRHCSGSSNYQVMFYYLYLTFSDYLMWQTCWGKVRSAQVVGRRMRRHSRGLYATHPKHHKVQIWGKVLDQSKFKCQDWACFYFAAPRRWRYQRKLPALSVVLVCDTSCYTWSDSTTSKIAGPGKSWRKPPSCKCWWVH